MCHKIYKQHICSHESHARYVYCTSAPGYNDQSKLAAGVCDRLDFTTERTEEKCSQPDCAFEKHNRLWDCCQCGQKHIRESRCLHFTPQFYEEYIPIRLRNGLMRTRASHYAKGAYKDLYPLCCQHLCCGDCRPSAGSATDGHGHTGDRIDVQETKPCKGDKGWAANIPRERFASWVDKAGMKREPYYHLTDRTYDKYGISIDNFTSEMKRKPRHRYGLRRKYASGRSSDQAGRKDA